MFQTVARSAPLRAAPTASLAAMLVVAAALATLALSPPSGAMAQPLVADVRLEQTDEMGSVYADADGRSLYVWIGDKPGQSRCNDDRPVQVSGSGEVSYHLPDVATRMTCQQMWPPLLASPGSTPAGRWTLISRKDGSRQWAFDQKPVYRFFQDAQPGEINGYSGGLNRTTSGRYPLWGPLQAPAGIIGRLTSVGRVLMTDAGKTLYTFEGEQPRKIICSGDCLRQWRPLAAPAVAEEIGDWSVTLRPDGLRQWAFKGRPLYTHAGDVRFGELNGLDHEDWQAAVLQKPLATPPGITRQLTADGDVFADADGRTLYSWGCVEEADDRGLCDVPGASESYRRSLCGPPSTCIATWRPVPAPAHAKPVGRTWSVVTIDPTGAYHFTAPGQSEGLRVWAYRGRPVYTFAGDKDAGDINGHNVRAFVLWGYSMLRVDGGGRLGG